jgi:hypothetical protein
MALANSTAFGPVALGVKSMPFASTMVFLYSSAPGTVPARAISQSAIFMGSVKLIVIP